jgi:hypothetical protein
VKKRFNEALTKDIELTTSLKKTMSRHQRTFHAYLSPHATNTIISKPAILTTLSSKNLSKMPNIIHIPLRYQHRAHNFPQPYTTSARFIAISTESVAALTIAADAEAWGWHVQYRDPEEPEIKEQWGKYCRMARDRGW